MAEQISDEKFKSEVMRFIEIANQKFDGLTADIGTNSFKLDRMENRLNRVEAIMAMDDHKRFENLEGRVNVIEGGPTN